MKPTNGLVILILKRASSENGMLICYRVRRQVGNETFK